MVVRFKNGVIVYNYFNFTTKSWKSYKSINISPYFGLFNAYTSNFLEEILFNYELA